MPRIIVQAEPQGKQEPVNTLAERVQTSDLESDHFAAQLIERVGWAVEDARAVEAR
ncbi:MAG: hypothetical protein NVSMB51_05120 [Solirubrobacteraceae bacterium]